jgi:4-amino-4-deoxy-L-arabinose transferase-like glycosyltransferase
MEKIKKHWGIILLLTILLVGGFLRLYRISEYMTFLGDEGRDALVVKRMIVDHKFTLLGPTASVGGFFLGPIYYYMMAPFLWAWRLNPTGPAVMVALFGVATIYLVWRAGRDWFSERVGLIAAALYAVSPVVIAYSRASWNPNIVPFFSLALVYILWKAAHENRWKLLFWAGVICGIGLQLHYLFGFLMVFTLVWVALFGRSVRNIQAYGLGLIGFVVGYGPFLLFELRHGFPNTITIFRFLTEGKDVASETGSFLKVMLEIPYRAFGRLVFRLPQPEVWEVLPQTTALMWAWGIRAAIVGSLAVLVAKAISLGKSAVKSERLGAMLLLVWFVLILVLFGFYRKAIYDYYFGIMFTLPFLAFGVLMDALAKKRIGVFVASVVVGGVLLLNLDGHPFKFAPNRQYYQARAIAQAAFEKAEGKPYNFALVTENNSDHVYRFFFEIWGQPPVTIEPPQIDPERKTVTDQLIVICEMVPCYLIGHPLWEIAGFGQAEIVGEWDVPFVKIYKLIHYEEP